VADLPAPLYAGSANASAIGNATLLPNTLLYSNLETLTRNETPEDIRDAFGLTQYDSGNSTDSAFVGVFTATRESAEFGQYIATQPLDRFVCGGHYAFALDTRLVPTYGGITKAEFTISSAGLCPDVEGYNTFEVTAVPSSSSTPELHGEDILLSINAKYPGMGVDFRDSNNIDSYKFTIISPLPQTEEIDDLKVYVLNGKWTTQGVDILSRQLLGPGTNKGMVQLEVSVDYLGLFIVTGKQLPPTEPDGKLCFSNTTVCWY